MEAKQWFCCPTCLDAHESEEVAVMCCPLYPKRYWECGECSGDYDTKAEAQACCTVDGEQLPMPTPQELEAMGQERLFA